MVRVTIRPMTADDFAEVSDKPLPHRVRGITMALGQRVIGVGGIGYRPDGTVIAFAFFTDEARKYPAAMHRAGLAGIAQWRDSGVPLVIAEAQVGNAAAEPWLLRLGFEPREALGQKFFVWEPDAAQTLQR